MRNSNHTAGRSGQANAARKAMVGLVRFLAPGHAVAVGEERSSRTEGRVLERVDRRRKRIDPALLSAALSAGLVAQRKTGEAPAGAYHLTEAGRIALKRWLADPDQPFGDQHRLISGRTDPDHGRVKVNLAESPLAALARLKDRDGTCFLDPELIAAGERLRSDFTRGQLLPSVSQRWDPVRISRRPGCPDGTGDLTDAAMAARGRVEAAIAAVGPELSGVLLDACCFLKGLTLIERERQWPVRSAKLMLRTALAALERHYRAPGARNAAATRIAPVSPPSAPPPRAP